MSGLLGKKGGATQERYAGMQISTSLQGQVIPYVAGRNRVTMNLVWYGNFQSHGPGSSGKGGGGGSQSWTYSTAFIAALALGPIQGIYTVYHDKSVVTLTYENLSYALGTSGQPTWSAYPSGTPTGQEIPYDHLAYVATNSYNLGSSAAMPNLTFEIEGVVPGYSDAHGMYDADPSAVIIDYLTDPVHGAGFPGTIATLTGTTNTYQAYVQSLGLLVSPIENSQRAATDFLKELLQITNSDAVLSFGTLKIIPYADAPVSGTTADGVHWSYTPNLTPVYSFTDSDFCPKSRDEPVRLTRTPISKTYNIVNVEYLDRSNYYNPAPVSASDMGDIAVRGPRAMSTLSFHQITSATVAKMAAQLILQFQLYERNTYEFRVRSDYSLLEPMDYIALTDSGLGLSNQVCRIVEVQDDADNFVTIKAMEVPGTVRNTPQYNWDASQGYAANFDEAPGSVQAPVIFQMPQIAASISEGITLGIAVCGPTSAAFWGGAEVYCSLDGGSTYEWVGTVGSNGPARYGTTTGAISAVADPDTTTTLPVALANTTEQLSTAVTHADADAAQTLIMVGNGSTAEIMAYGTAALVSAGNYNLSYLRRGMYGSLDQAHASMVPFVRLDGSIFQIPMDPGMAGQTVYFKFTSFNSVGRATEELSAVTAYSYTLPVATSAAAALTARGSAIVNGNTLYKATTGTAGWDSDAYAPPILNGAVVTWRFGGNLEAAAGLASSVAAAGSNAQMPLYIESLTNGTFQVALASGTIVSGPTAFTATDAFEVRYDGTTLRAFRNGVLLYAIRAPGLTLYPYATLYSPGAVIADFAYGPITANTTLGGNLLTTYPWVVGTSGSQGNYADNYDGTHEDSSIILAGTSSSPLGPYGTSEAIWKAVGTGTTNNGGWNNHGDLYGIDPTKTYRSVVWIYWNGTGTPDVYHGCDVAYTNNLAGTQNTNPYFASGAPSALGMVGGRWYLMVGILHGAGYNGASSGLSGVYDPSTGKQVYAGTDYVIIAGAPYQTHRAYQYNANNSSSIVYFAKPRFEEVTGSEPAIATLLAPATQDALPDGTTFVRLLASHAVNNVAYNFKGIWSSATAYVQGDEVVYGSTYWVATAGSTNVAPATGSADWQSVGSYAAYQGAWSSTTAYVPGSEVTYSGNYWICVTANTNSAPSTSNGNWQVAGPTNLDFVPDGSTFNRTLATALTSGQVDLSKAGVIGRTLLNIADGGTRYAVINGAGLNAVSYVDGANRALIDFSQSGHTNKTLDNIPNGVVYGRHTLGGLSENMLDNGGPSIGTSGSAAPGWLSNANLTTGTDPNGTASVLLIQSPSITSSQVKTGYLNIQAGNTYIIQGWYKTGGTGSWQFGFQGPMPWQVVGAPTAWTFFSVSYTAASGYTGTAALSAFLFDNNSATADTLTLWGWSVRKVRSLDTEVADGSTYGRVKIAGLTSGVPDPSIGGIVAKGSTPPILPGGTFTYTSTTTSVTVSWTAFTIYRPDGTTTAVSAGSYATITGLTAGTTYTVYPYWNEATSALLLVTGGTGHGTPAACYASGGDPVAAASMLLNGCIALNGFNVSTPASGSGGGSGGGFYCLHPETVVQLSDSTEKWATDLSVGDYLPAPGGAARIETINRILGSLWIDVMVDEMPWGPCVTPDHKFYLAIGEQIKARDLRLGDILTADGNHREVTGLELRREEAHVVQVELAHPHLYYVGGLLSHNIKA